MAVSIQEVEKIAELALLDLTEDEKQKFTRQLNIIFEYMENLNELDTSDVEPMSHPLNLKNVFRKDEIKSSLSVEKALENAPERTLNFFKVPRIISK